MKNAEEKFGFVEKNTIPRLAMLAELLGSCAKKTEEAGDALTAITLEGATALAGDMLTDLMDLQSKNNGAE